MQNAVGVGTKPMDAEMLDKPISMTSKRLATKFIIEKGDKKNEPHE